MRAITDIILVSRSNKIAHNDFYNPQATCFMAVFLCIPCLAVIFPKQSDKLPPLIPTMFQHWKKFGANRNAKQMLGSAVVH